MKTNTDTPARLTIFSAIVGILFALATAYLGHVKASNATKPDEKIVHIVEFGNLQSEIIIGVVAAIFCFQLSELWRHRKISPQLASLERSLKDQDFYEILSELIDHRESIRVLKRNHSKCTQFYSEREGQLYAQLLSELRTLSKGEIKIEDEIRELTANRDFLLMLPERKVSAISYQDGEFWSEEAGKKFLVAHQTMITDRKLEITRIFILSRAEALAKRAIIEHQMSIGISCEIALDDEVPAKYREDFVIYDDKYVRHAKLAAETPQTTLKTATLTASVETVAHYLQIYSYLCVQAVGARDFYAKLDAGGGAQKS